MTCADGTMLQDDACIAPAALVCAPGTHASSGACVADGGTAYQVRTRGTAVADGVTPIEILVYGTNPDGSAATDEIVLGTDRFGAGDFTPAVLTLDPQGSVATFLPCKATDAGCTGPLEITIARTSAPTVPIARSGLKLVATPAVADASHCPTGRDSFYLDGTRFLYGGQLSITDATILRGGGTQRAELQIYPTDPIQGTEWALTFTTIQLGTKLLPGVYEGAFAGPPAGSPGMTITGATPYATCRDTYEGDFQVFDYAYTTSLLHATISFREWCSEDPTTIVSGCVHVE